MKKTITTMMIAGALALAPMAAFADEHTAKDKAATGKMSKDKAHDQASTETASADGKMNGKAAKTKKNKAAKTDHSKMDHSTETK